jgi:hypothetical protein
MSQQRSNNHYQVRVMNSSLVSLPSRLHSSSSSSLSFEEFYMAKREALLKSIGFSGGTHSESEDDKKNKRNKIFKWTTLGASVLTCLLFVQDNYKFNEKVLNPDEILNIDKLLTNHFRWHWLTNHVKIRNRLPTSFQPLTVDNLKHQHTWKELEQLTSSLLNTRLLQAVMDRSSKLWSISTTADVDCTLNWKAFESASNFAYFHNDFDKMSILLKGYSKQFNNHVSKKVKENLTNINVNAKLQEEERENIIWDHLVESFYQNHGIRRLFNDVFMTSDAPDDVHRFYMLEVYNAARRGGRGKMLKTIHWWFQCKTSDKMITDELTKQIETEVMSIALADQRPNRKMKTVADLQKLLGFFRHDESLQNKSKSSSNAHDDDNANSESDNQSKKNNNVENGIILHVILPKEYLIEATRQGRLDLLRECNEMNNRMFSEEDVVKQQAYEQFKIATLVKQEIFDVAVKAEQTEIVNWMMETKNILGTTSLNTSTFTNVKCNKCHSSITKDTE